MKNIFIILFVILISFSCKNNKNDDKKILENELIKLPPIQEIVDENSLVGFACYYSGRPSNPVKVITEILEEKKYNELKKKISSINPAEKYLATYSCIKLSKKGIIKLNSNELRQINNNKKSDLKIYFCGGCTEKESYKLSQLFSGKTEFILELENWFNQIK
jgi:hypothetical protein